MNLSFIYLYFDTLNKAKRIINAFSAVGICLVDRSFEIRREKEDNMLYAHCMFPLPRLEASSAQTKCVHVTCLATNLTWSSCMCSTIGTIISHTMATTFHSAKWDTTPAGGRSVETNLSWTCLVSWLLSFEHPSVLLFTNHFLHLIFLCNLP